MDALAAPVAITSFFFALLTEDKLKVTLSGGGFGESEILSMPSFGTCNNTIA